ncbi:MAG: chromate efflux transporter [Planctomycetota bacterium]|nr:chromate efflux transporter [Planctomycetota bacterium]
MDGSDGPMSDRISRVSLRDAFWTWCRVAALSFGGPAGQIAVMHRILVDEKKWIDERRFLHALNFCMLLPGPEAQQLATYIGWLMHRTLGGLMAGLLFILPGFVTILALSIVYATWHETNFVQAIFFGLKPAVMAIVLDAVRRIGGKVLKSRTMFVLAALSFVAVFVFHLPFPLLILAAGAIGFAGGFIAPGQFLIHATHGVGNSNSDLGISDKYPVLRDEVPSYFRSLVILVAGLVVWFAPVVAVIVLFGESSIFVREALLFSQAAVVTFGGAYSVLVYIAQQSVEKFGWLQPGEMLDGLGMAETTPGPLIMVVQFVGFLAAYRHPGQLRPLVAGILGSVLTTWVTFVPCFLWIFLGAPYVERLRANRRLSAALSAITASVVGVILNLALWFSVHTLFHSVGETSVLGGAVLTPNLETIDLCGVAVAGLALVMTFWWKCGMLTTMSTSALVGIVLFFARRAFG